MYRLMLMMILTLLVCCQPKPDSTPQQSNDFPPAPLSKEPSPNPLKATIVPLEGANHYAVKLNWEEATAFAEGWRLTKESEKVTSEIFQSSENERFFQDTQVVSNQAYRYFLWKLSPSGSVITATAMVRIPKDEVISGEVISPDLRGIRRLFLKKGTRLLAQDRGVTIDVEELYSDEATIQAFDPLLSQKENTPGRHGGAISIRSKIARGKLSLIANGETGGDGSHGLAGKNGSTGKAGENALAESLIKARQSFYNPARANLQYLNSEEEAVEFRTLVEKLLPGCRREWRQYQKCVRPPTMGENGSDGEKGAQGRDGAPGGNTSPLYLAIDDPKDFSFHFTQEPGKGGKGGIGGSGGHGGEGGPSGKLDPHCVCDPSPHHSIAGKEGANGTNGQMGANGIVTPYCLILAGAKQGNCEQFKSDET